MSDGTVRRTLPSDEDPGRWRQLTVQLDSGSIGRAGGGFATNGRNDFVHMVYDKVHAKRRGPHP